LLRVALRVEMKPTDIHTIVTTLLGPLENKLGIAETGKITAFTPTPFSFPTAAALERHVFTKDYEFSTLRVMFVAWILSEDVHRELEEFKAPRDMEIVLQHTEALKKLRAHPESAVRVALVYVFNEVQLGYKSE
jgi:hypothetical protein